jgi:2-polyprenyl-6-methoxyphenol hydroxylase-like FAD-dependent oxidoreductase
VTSVSAASRPTQVLIAGGGPVGLSAAVELGLRGISCVVVEPRAQPTRTRPRAKTLNVRTMEHLRRWGVADRLRSVAPLPTWWSQDIAFCTSLLGTEITRFTGVLGLSDEGVSPELGQQAPQYVLEEMLREMVQDLATCTFLVGSRVTGLDLRDDSVEVQVQHRDGQSESVLAEFVLGADGPRSVVREAIGARYEGTHAQRPNLGVMFRSAKLMDLLPNPPAVQSWLVNDRTPGVMGPVDRGGTWWLIAFGVDAAANELDLHQLVDGALGRPVATEIISTDPWTARMELADRCRAGRVFLVGDAAHLNPPFGGHGVNTGIGDAVDLGWKLAAVLDGWGGPGLLDSYEAERRPLQQRVIAEAAKNMSVLSTQLVRESMDDPGPRGAQTRLMVAEQIRATKSAEYFSLDLVLGHQYRDSPVIVADRADGPPDDQWAATARPGLRIPHAWLRPGVSSLDLAGPGFSVVASDTADTGSLTRAAAARRVPMTVHHEGAADLPAQLGANVIIMRPDHVVAWCGKAVPADATTLLDQITGRVAASCAGAGHNSPPEVHPRPTKRRPA